MTPGDLRRLAFGFRAARALFAGVEIGLFEAIGSETRPVPELASELSLDERGLRMLLDALTSLRVLQRSARGYRIPTALQASLVPGGDAYLGNLFLHDLWHWTSWAALDESLRRGERHESYDGDRHLGNPEVLVRFLPNYNIAMEQAAADSLPLLADAIVEHAPRSLLDLGSGSGKLSFDVCDRLPGTRALLVDHEFALAAARARRAASGVADRVELLPFDFEEKEIPRGHDAIVLSRILMGMGSDRAEHIIGRAAEALDPGGVLFVHDFDSRSSVGALLSLDMLLNTGGEVHSEESVCAMLAKAGLELEESRNLLPYTRLWIGRKPR